MICHLRESTCRRVIAKIDGLSEKGRILQRVQRQKKVKKIHICQDEPVVHMSIHQKEIFKIDKMLLPTLISNKSKISHGFKGKREIFLPKQNKTRRNQFRGVVESENINTLDNFSSSPLSPPSKKTTQKIHFWAYEQRKQMLKMLNDQKKF